MPVHQSTDRNLYVNDIIYNGIDTKQSAALMAQQAFISFAVSGGTTPSVSETSDHGSVAAEPVAAWHLHSRRRYVRPRRRQ